MSCWITKFFCIGSIAALISACSEPITPPLNSSTVATDPEEIAINPLRNVYFGDLHVHTNQSFDAYIMGAREDADAAYRFAKGEALTHPSGRVLRLEKPLDFQMVSDHGVYLGMLPAMMDSTTSVSQHPLALELRGAKEPADRAKAFGKIVPRVTNSSGDDDLLDQTIVNSAWQKNIAAAERHNEPGVFTTFIGYEYTSTGPEFENLHRNVVFKGRDVPTAPFTRLESTNPEDLWQWMDDLRDSGIDSLAIPHNSNGSNGWMFKQTKWNHEPIDSNYAEQRMRNEPLVENTQVKGTSDTHPLLSPNDEWANFEIMPDRVASPLSSQSSGSYVREAFLRGIKLRSEIGINPFQFGVIGSSDTHVSAGSFDESDYWAKIGLMDATPQQRGSVPVSPSNERLSDNAFRETINLTYGASGLAGVWAQSNTRASLFAALRRKETFSTSGTRIKLRFFAGAYVGSDLVKKPNNIEIAYDYGVPMGATLSSSDPAPDFFLWAARDPGSAALQRLQIIKGWYEQGQLYEQVYDVACANNEAIHPETNRCPDNNASVDLTDCSVREPTGSAQLNAIWQDPNFNSNQQAFYYARVLENPTCRWSTWDALRAGTKPNPRVPTTIQERAWSSPIWYEPSGLVEQKSSI